MYVMMIWFEVEFPINKVKSEQITVPAPLHTQRTDSRNSNPKVSHARFHILQSYDPVYLAVFRPSDRTFEVDKSVWQWKLLAPAIDWQKLAKADTSVLRQRWTEEAIS